MSHAPAAPPIRLLDGRWYQREPVDDYAWLREHAPLYWDEEGELWGVSRYEDVMFVSRHAELFCSDQGSRPDSNVPSMINMDDPHHKRRRNLVNRGFTPRKLVLQEEKARAVCVELIEKVAPRGECEFVHEVAAVLPMVMIGDMLGVEPEDRDTLLRWSDDLLRTSGSDEPKDLEAAALAGMGWFEYAQRVIEDRRANPRDDLVSLLVQAEVDGQRLSDEEIQHDTLLILVGGDETTRHVLTRGLEMLIRHPEQRQRLVADPSKLPVAVEEMLRWVSPIKNMNRTATRDVDLRGQKIREGDRLLLLYHAANLDERVFERADHFDVEREPNPHVAFGGYGTHHCLGASLARMELRVMFEELLARLPDLELASEEPLPLRRNNFIVGIEEMPLRFSPRA